MLPLTTVENVKNYLGINSPNDDALLDRLVTAASDYIQKWLNRNFGAQEYVEKQNGQDMDVCMVRNYPIISVAEVKVGEVVVPPATSTLDAGYVYNDTSIMLQGYVFPRGKNNVKFTYTAGIDTPSDVEQACIELIAHRYKERDRIGLVSKGLAGETTAFSQKDMPESVRTLLATYKKVIPN